nr:hypothetical protein [Tanacetum cinerariifolium]
MDQQNPTLAKIPILDTGKFEQWQFRIQQYLQHEHYALWEVIEFGDSYEVPASTASTTTTDTTSGGTSKKSGRTITLIAKDMQKRKNDVKARTILLLSLPDEHQLRFSKYKTAQELWAAILKTFGGNEATKKTKKNLLKQQYGNFKAEGSETLEQTLNRLQVIVGQLQFIDVEVEHDDLNQKFLTSLAPEWLMHTIVWRNRSDLDTMSLDDLYNHLKVYESEVQKKSEPDSQNMAFISSAKHSRGNEDVNTTSVSTASTNVPTASANIGVASISQDTACAYLASQSSCSKIKFEDINQIDEDDMEEMDIKWNMTLLSMRADKFWKKTGKKISIQGLDVAGFDKSKVECFNYHKMGYFARECRAPRSQDRGKRDNYKQGSKVEEQAPKALMAIDGELETLKKEKEGVDGKLAGFLTASKDLDNLIESQRSDKNKEGLGYSDVPPPLAQIYSFPKKDLSWTGLLEFTDDMVTDYSRPSPTMESTSGDDQNRNSFILETDASPSTITPKPFIKFVKPKDLEDIIKSQRSEKVKEGVGYNAVPPPAADLYLSPKKDLSWTGLLEFVDDNVTDYSRPSPTVASTSAEDQNNDTSTSEEIASTNPSKPFIKFVKPKDSQPESKIEEQETPKKLQVKNSEQNRQSNRRSKGNQRNLNNLKSYQLAPEFVLHKKPCFNCGDFTHLAKDYRRRVQRETNRSQNHSYKSSTHRSASHIPNGAHMRPPRRSSGPRP